MRSGVFQTCTFTSRTSLFVHEGLGPLANCRASVFFRMSFNESDKSVVARVHGLSVRQFHFHLIVCSVKNNLNGVFDHFLQRCVNGGSVHLQNGSHLLVDPRVLVFTQRCYSSLLNAFRIIWNYFLNVNFRNFTQSATITASAIRAIE